MLERVLLCSLNEYSFTDDTTGNLVEGATVWVLPLTSDNKYINGLQPSKYSITKEFAQELNGLSLPVYADMHLTVDLARKSVKAQRFDNFKDFTI